MLPLFHQEMIMDIYPFDDADDDYPEDKTIHISGGILAMSAGHVTSAEPSSPKPSWPQPSSPNIPPVDYDVDDYNEMPAESPSDSPQEQPVAEKYHIPPSQTHFFPPPPVEYSSDVPSAAVMPADSASDPQSEPQAESSDEEFPPPPSSFMEDKPPSDSRTDSLLNEAVGTEDAGEEDVQEPVNYEYDVSTPPLISAAAAAQPVPLADEPREVLDEPPSDLKTVTFGGEIVVGESRGYAGSTITYDSETGSGLPRQETYPILIPTEMTPVFETMQTPLWNRETWPLMIQMTHQENFWWFYICMTSILV